MAFRTLCFLEAALQLSKSRVPIACNSQRFLPASHKAVLHQMLPAVFCCIYRVSSERREGFCCEIAAEKWDESSIFLVKLISYKQILLSISIRLSVTLSSLKIYMRDFFVCLFAKSKKLHLFQFG